MTYYWKRDPGPCPVDDAPHTTCTAPTTAITVVQLPGRDGVTPTPLVGAVQVPTASVAAREFVPRTPTEFTTKTYSRAKHGRLVGRAR